MNTQELQQKFQQAANTIRDADAILIGAGAGMGVDSGLPDFRGNEGFWKAYPPFRKLNLSFVQLANPQWFSADPHRAWGFYGHRKNLYMATEPHAGFQVLLNWCQEKEDYFVFTSNVDGHFQKAGFDPERVVECHGSIQHMQCNQPCQDSIWLTDESVVIDESTMRADDPLPRCPECQQIARPNILMFGDWHWVDSRSESQARRFRHWQRAHQTTQVAIIEFGAGTAVPTVRWECESQNGTLIRINPRESHGPNGTISIELGALEAVEQINSLL